MKEEREGVKKKVPFCSIAPRPLKYYPINVEYKPGKYIINKKEKKGIGEERKKKRGNT